MTRLFQAICLALLVLVSLTGCKGVGVTSQPNSMDERSGGGDHGGGGGGGGGGGM
jgi:hypothetical protein